MNVSKETMNQFFKSTEDFSYILFITSYLEQCENNIEFTTEEAKIKLVKLLQDNADEIISSSMNVDEKTLSLNEIKEYISKIKQVG